MHNFGSVHDMVAAGETLFVEFKRQVNDKDLVRASVCLANGQGGVLLIGVDDDGKVLGAAPRHGETTDPARIAAYILNHTEPPLVVEVTLPQVQGREIIRVDVPTPDAGPVGTKDGLFIRRTLDSLGKPQCSPMTVQEIISTGAVLRGQDYASTVAMNASFDDLDPAEFQLFRSLAQAAGDPIHTLGDEDLLKALGLIPVNAPLSLGAILLFGRPEAVRRWAPTAEFLFQDLRSNAIPINEALQGPLVSVATELDRLLEERNSAVEMLIGLQRIEIPLIPTATIRESIANALVHRDYSALGPTTVQITDDELIVANPGSFPPGVTVHNILDQSRPRSPLLAGAFKRCGLVERRGKGVNDIYEGQLRAGRDTPSYTRSTTQSVVLNVSLATSDLDLVRFLLTWENENQRALALDDLRVVHAARASGSVTTQELVDALGMLPNTARAVGGRLVEAGILESRGAGRNRAFHLTARFYDLAQDRSAYVRVKGADPFQQERMILDYVAAYGQITRSQAAELCQSTPTQARSILKRLVDQQKLVLRGERRGAHYVLPPELTG